MIKLKEGDKAPLFTGVDQDGKKVSLSSYKGEKVLLYFYPQDNTSTCTVQACNLRDNFSLLKKKGIHVLGVSPDDVASHKKFESNHKLPFTLIADTSRAIMDKYGVWGEKQMFGNKYMGVHRTSFLIGENGKILKVFLRPKSKEHAEEVMAAVNE